MSRKNRFDPTDLKPVDLEALATARPRTSTTWLGDRMKNLESLERSAKLRTIYLSPAECSIWEGNARNYEQLSQATCQELIDAIQTEGGNRVPVVVRPHSGGEGSPPYELIVGTRRHWSVAWLNANGHPKLRLLAIVEEIDDEGAFRLADVENRARTDISAVERGRNYRTAIDRYYGGVQSRMAERLRISPGHLSQLLSIASLPDEVIAAFASDSAITIANIRPVLQAVKVRASDVVASALKIAGEQQERRAAGLEPLDAQAVIQRLVREERLESAAERTPPVLVAGRGRAVGRVVRDSRKGLVLHIDPARADDIDEILEALRPVILSSRAVRQG